MKWKGVDSISLAGVIMLFVALVFPTSEVFSQPMVLKLGHITSPLSTRNRAAVKFAEWINERTQGKIKVDVYPAEQLGNASAQFEALSMGTQDICIEAVAWYNQFVKDFGYYNTPFVFNTYPELYKAYESDIGRAMFDEVIRKVGIRCLAYNFEQSLRSLYSVKKPIRTPDDLKGVKMRVPEIRIYVDAWKILGATTVRVSWGELYTGLSQGLVEACEGPITDTYNSKFFDIVKYITHLQYKPSTGTISISEKTWKKFSPDIQKILEKTAKDAGEFFTKIETAEVDKVIDALKKQKDITFVDFNLQAFTQKAAGLAPALEKDGLWSKGLHEKMEKILGRR